MLKKDPEPDSDPYGSDFKPQDPGTDPFQNVSDPEHWLPLT